METTNLGRKNRGALRSAILFLLGYSLAACASTVSPPPKINAPREVHSAMAQTIRTIIYFQRPTADNKNLSAAIANACRCQPLFVRSYDSDALIYEIVLSQGQSFDAFKKALMQNAVQLGIKIVEQDRVMHIQ
jgi:Tfp pilus assembly protein PilF